MQESSLHNALKNWYVQPGDVLEVAVEGYFIDLVRGKLLVEIQTRNFAALKPKLAVLVENHPVRLVHPIAQERWIVRRPRPDQPATRRKSPRHGRFEHLFSELVRIPQLIAHPNFSLEILLTREEEILEADGRGSWRRKGWSIADRKLLEVVDRLTLSTPQDFERFLPASLPQPFTTQDLSQAAAIPRPLAGKAVFCLSRMGLIEFCGKRGKSHLYTCASRVKSAG